VDGAAGVSEIGARGVPLPDADGKSSVATEEAGKPAGCRHLSQR